MKLLENYVFTLSESPRLALLGFIRFILSLSGDPTTSELSDESLVAAISC